jgi:hypothetical protein
VVCLVKFIRKALEEVKSKTFAETMALSKIGLDTIFSTCYFALDEFEKGHPSWGAREAWKIWIIGSIKKGKGIPKEVLIRSKEVHSESKHGLTEEDILWIKQVLRPYFDEQLKRETGKVYSMLTKLDHLQVGNNIKKYNRVRNLSFR